MEMARRKDVGRVACLCSVVCHALPEIGSSHCSQVAWLRCHVVLLCCAVFALRLDPNGAGVSTVNLEKRVCALNLCVRLYLFVRVPRQAEYEMI